MQDKAKLGVQLLFNPSQTGPRLDHLLLKGMHLSQQTSAF